MRLGKIDPLMLERLEAKKFARTKRAKLYPHPTNPLFIHTSEMHCAHPLTGSKEYDHRNPPRPPHQGFKLPMGFPADLANEMENMDVPFRFSYRSGDDVATQYFLPTKAQADEYDMDYYEEWWDLPNEKGWVNDFVLTDDGYVAWVERFIVRNTKDGEVKIFMGPLVLGIVNHDGRKLMTYIHSHLRARNRLPAWWHAALKLKNHVASVRHLGDPRVKSMVDLYLITGDIAGSYASVFGETSENSALRKGRSLIKKKKVQTIMSERAADYMKYSLEKAGILDKPEEYVMGALIKVSQALLGDLNVSELATDDPRMLKIALDTVSRMGEYLNLGEQSVVTETESQFLLTEDDERKLLVGTSKTKKTPVELEGIEEIEVASEIVDE